MVLERIEQLGGGLFLDSPFRIGGGAGTDSRALNSEPYTRNQIMRQGVMNSRPIPHPGTSNAHPPIPIHVV